MVSGPVQSCVTHDVQRTLFVVFAESLRRSPVSYTKMVTLKLDDRLLAAYLFYGSILMLKTWAMSFFTARHRLQNKVRSDPYVATGVRHLRISAWYEFQIALILMLCSIVIV